MTKTITKLGLICLSLMTFVACSDDDDNVTTPPAENLNDDVFGLVISEMNDGQTNEFWSTRTAFVDDLLQQPGVLQDDAFEAFLDFDTTINEQNVVVGLTAYDNEEAIASTFAFLGGSQTFAAYDQTFTGLNTVVLKTLDGQAFDPNTLTVSGQAVEFAIRSANDANSFGSLRDAFFNLLPNYDGFLFDREFEVYDLQQDGSIIKRENTQAVIIVWETQAAFISALGNITQTPEFANFSQNITAENYFATSPR